MQKWPIKNEQLNYIQTTQILQPGYCRKGRGLLEKGSFFHNRSISQYLLILKIVINASTSEKNSIIVTNWFENFLR